MSKGEEKIAQILRASGLKFESEYIFSDCRSNKHAPMRFDFAILDDKGNVKWLCEFDGAQHMEQIKCFQWTRRDFMRTQQHDREKNAYALAHNIPLFRVPYWELDNLKTLADIQKSEHRVRSRYHNDDLKPPQ